DDAGKSGADYDRDGQVADVAAGQELLEVGRNDLAPSQPGCRMTDLTRLRESAHAAPALSQVVLSGRVCATRPETPASTTKQQSAWLCRTVYGNLWQREAPAAVLNV